MDPVLQEVLNLNEEAIELDAHIVRGFLAGDVASRIDAYIKQQDEKYERRYGSGSGAGSTATTTGGGAGLGTGEAPPSS